MEREIYWRKQHKLSPSEGRLRQTVLESCASLPLTNRVELEYELSNKYLRTLLK